MLTWQLIALKHNVSTVLLWDFSSIPNKDGLYSMFAPSYLVVSTVKIINHSQ